MSYKRLLRVYKTLIDTTRIRSSQLGYTELVQILALIVAQAQAVFLAGRRTE